MSKRLDKGVRMKNKQASKNASSKKRHNESKMLKILLKLIQKQSS
jgi:hypothetical protein